MGLFIFVTILFTVVSILMILIILVQRPQGGGLAGAFGGASGGGTDTVFGGRVGDALTVMTVIAFALYLLLAVGLNMLDNKPDVVASTQPAVTTPPTTSPADATSSVQTITFPSNPADGSAQGLQVTPITVTTPGAVTPVTTPPPAAPSGSSAPGSNAPSDTNPPPTTAPSGGGGASGGAGGGGTP